MALINEKILLNYLHEIEYNNDALNAIGATTDTTGLRVIETPSTAATKYVKKFGNAYTITDISAGSVTVPRSDGGGVNKWWYEFYDFDTHTLMATVKDENGASTFVKGATLAGPASGIYVKVVWKSGTVSIADADRVRVTTDIDGAGRNIRLSAESFASGERLFYFAYSSSSYYMDSVTDQSAMYGGYRVAGGGSLRQPYYNIQEAIDAVAAAGAPFDNVTVLDSETYDEQLDLDVAGIFLQAALGQTPIITSGVGARASREMVNQGNNADTAYVSKTLALGGVGTYQDPYTTIAAAFAGIGARTNIHIMDSNTYTEALTFNAAVILEPLYGQVPILSGNIVPTHVAVGIYGIYIMGNSATVGIDMQVVNYTGSAEDNTVNGSIIGILFSAGFASTFAGTISRNVCFNSRDDGISMSMPSNGTVDKNITYSNGDSGLRFTVNHNDSSMTITNNVSYNNTLDGIQLFTDAGRTYTGNLENNTLYNNRYGLFVSPLGPVTGNIRNIIAWGNTTFDLFKELVLVVTITFSNWLTNSGFTDGGNNISSDPRFCKTTQPYQLGLSSNSEAYRADTFSKNMGANLNIVEINESDVTVNGFIINGQSAYNESIFIADVADHTGMIIIWNTIESLNGIALDPYDDDVDTAAIIKNNIIRDCGNGIKLSRGSNTVQENLIYNNTIYGIFLERTLDNIIHNTIVDSQYGLYLESTAASTTVRDNIFSRNSINDIFSEVALVVTYNCIDGAITDNVTALPATNVLTAPLFVDVDANDYNLKVIENGYSIDSQCREAASDGKDMGAWDMSRSIESESWRKYQLAWNPRKLDPEYNGKGVTKFENARGFTKMFEKGHLRVLPFQWSRTQASTEKLWKKMQYLSSLVPDRDQGRIADQCRIRVNPLPAQLILSGTAATISAATKTILDTNLDLTEDELKGYWASIKFLSGTGMTIDAALKTGTVAGSPWVINEHVGRYQHLHGNYYVVKSNTVNAATLSDARDTLVNEVTAWAFEKYFKMIKTENQILHLEDDDGEIPTGSYDYYVDFIEMHVVKPTFKTLQERFYWLQETWKTGFSLFLEEL